MIKAFLEKGAIGKAILFVGAGATLDCTNFNLTDLPTANPLLTKINNELGKNISRLDVAASMLADQNLSKYFNLVCSTYNVRSIPNDLVDICRFPWSRIYTTNYDNALEIASRTAGVARKSIIPADRESKQPDGVAQIVHLHGFVERFDLDNVRSDCILDYGSNIANAVYEGRWGLTLRNDLINSDVAVFLGYSLYDPEIPKLIKAAGITREKIFFINSHIENEELIYRQKDFGKSMNLARDGFSRILMSSQKQSKKRLRQNFVSFEMVSTDAADVAQANTAVRCPIPDDHISPRRSAFFMARSVLRDIRSGVRTC